MGHATWNDRSAFAADCRLGAPRDAARRQEPAGQRHRRPGDDRSDHLLGDRGGPHHGERLRGLHRQDPEGKIIPALATTWEPLAAEDGFRFNLRKGVVFHSGRPFTAKDVKYYFETLLTPGTKARSQRKLSRQHRRRRRGEVGRGEGAEGRQGRRRPHPRGHVHEARRAVPDLPVPVHGCRHRRRARRRLDDQGLGRHRPVQVQAMAARRRGRARGAQGLLGRRAEDRRRALHDRSEPRHGALPVRRRRARFPRRAGIVVPARAARRPLQGPDAEGAARAGDATSA